MDKVWNVVLVVALMAVASPAFGAFVDLLAWFFVGHPVLVQWTDAKMALAILDLVFLFVFIGAALG